MFKKTHYKQLEKRISELEKQNRKNIIAEKSLKESEEKYRAMAKDLPNLICSFMPGWIITFINRGYSEYFSKPHEQLIGKNFLDFIPEKSRKAVTENILSLTPDNPTITHEHKVIGGDGEIRWQEWTDRAIFDENGIVLSYHSVGKDISEQKKLHEEKEDLINKLKTALEDIKSLSGLLPICANCKKIRDDKGYWNQLEKFIETHSDVQFSHGLCPECETKLYGHEDWYQKKIEQKKKK